MPCHLEVFPVALRFLSPLFGSNPQSRGGPGGRVWEQKGVKRHGGISPLAGLVGFQNGFRIGELPLSLDILV